MAGAWKGGEGCVYAVVVVWGQGLSNIWEGGKGGRGPSVDEGAGGGLCDKKGGEKRC